MESLFGAGDSDGSSAIVRGSVAFAKVIGLDGGIISADLLLDISVRLALNKVAS